MVDASALVRMLLDADVPVPSLEDAHAPHLVDAEVLSAMRRHVRLGTVDAGRARSLLDDFADLALFRHEHAYLLERAWTMRENLSAYDALYVALAEALDAPLVTADARIARAPGVRARVEVVRS